ncbi:MAG: hypothetical protein FRX49_11831 [Trebouxia sp. A1-2]|nr:MAG: hypothetical protein FRX49_11831 [Trebouxia sp. A1-2]
MLPEEICNLEDTVKPGKLIMAETATSRAGCAAGQGLSKMGQFYDQWILDQGFCRAPTEQTEF